MLQITYESSHAENVTTGPSTRIPREDSCTLVLCKWTQKTNWILFTTLLHCFALLRILLACIHSYHCNCLLHHYYQLKY